MRTSFLVALAVAVSGLSSASAQDSKTELKTTKQKFSYGVGRSIGQNLKSQGIELDVKAFMAGVAEIQAGTEAQLSEDELRDAMIAYQKEVQKKQAMAQLAKDPERKALAEKNAKEGKTFLAANLKKEGVKTTKSGLQYKVMKSGTGKENPKANSTVKTHYHGTLIDGTVFDSSVKRGEPVSFRVDQVISGWTEALQLMKAGDKWQLFIPSDLAYGLSPRPGGPIGPNAVLVFEVELIEIED